MIHVKSRVSTPMGGRPAARATCKASRAYRGAKRKAPSWGCFTRSRRTMSYSEPPKGEVGLSRPGITAAIRRSVPGSRYAMGTSARRTRNARPRRSKRHDPGGAVWRAPVWTSTPRWNNRFQGRLRVRGSGVLPSLTSCLERWMSIIAPPAPATVDPCQTPVFFPLGRSRGRPRLAPAAERREGGTSEAGATPRCCPPRFLKLLPSFLCDRFCQTDRDVCVSSHRNAGQQ